MEGKKYFRSSVMLVLLSIVLLTGCGDKGDTSGGNSGGGSQSTVTNTTSNTGNNTAGANGSGTATSTEVTVPEAQEVPELLVAKSEEPYNFCTKYSADNSYEWDDENGIIIYTGTKGYIPYVLVWRSMDANHSAQDVHQADISDIEFEYGDKLLSNSGIHTQTLGGKELVSVEYKYLLGETEVYLGRYIDESPRVGYVMYTAKYTEDTKDETLEALELAIENCKDNKDYYESGDSPEKDLEVVPGLAASMEYRTYDDGWMTIEIPKTWRVFANSFSGTAAAYVFHAFDTLNPDNQIYIGMQNLWFTDEAAYKKLVSYPLYGKEFEGLPYMITGEDPLVETYQNFNVFVDSSYGQYMKFTYMYDWTEMERLGETPLGGELIRATYKNGDGKEIEGIFTGKWAKGLKLYGYKYPGAMYSPMFISAAAEEFNEWQEVLSYCLSTVQYSQDYIDQYYAEEKATMQAFEANTQVYNEMSDMITSSWNARQTTYDTVSAKQSDATLGYERVYNTETMEVYRAEVGFTDSYTGTLYQPITEDMYSQPIQGYIYK